MNLFKRFKRESSKRDEDDDIIILESRTTTNVSEYCQYIDKNTGESCKEFYAVVCMHCNCYLCYVHVEMHRFLLIIERDQLIDELNRRINEINQLTENPDKIHKLLIENLEIRNQKKVSLLQQLSLEKLVDINKTIVELKQLFQPVRTILQHNQSVSFIQIKKIRESFLKFDENKKVKKHINKINL